MSATQTNATKAKRRGRGTDDPRINASSDEAGIPTERGTPERAVDLVGTGLTHLDAERTLSHLSKSACRRAPCSWSDPGRKQRLSADHDLLAGSFAACQLVSMLPKFAGCRPPFLSPGRDRLLRRGSGVLTRRLWRAGEVANHLGELIGR